METKENFICKLKEDMEPGLFFAISIESGHTGKSICDGCCYDIKECPKSNNIHVGIASYDIIDREKELPTQKAYCKSCGVESAKPIHYTRFNGKKGIVVECTKCHEMYILYEDRYKQMYVGHHTKYGFIPPTHGKKMTIPKNIKEKFDEEHKKSSYAIGESFGFSKEEWDENKKKWEEQRIKNRKRFEREENERIQKYREQQILDKQSQRKKLIDEGIIKYDKKSRCLVDTRTGEVVKL